MLSGIVAEVVFLSQGFTGGSGIKTFFFILLHLVSPNVVAAFNFFCDAGMLVV